MFPAQRGKVLQEVVVQRSLLAEGVRGSVKVDSVPEDDNRGEQGESAGPVALLLETAVADLSEAMEEYGPGQSAGRNARAQ